MPQFSSSTKKTEELKDFFEFCDYEWSELLKSVLTRWLSLIPAAERLLKKFQPVKSYFLSMNSLPAILQNFFQDEFAEAYLGFLVNVGSTLQTTIQKLQSDKALILELHETMIFLRRSLQTKFNQEFYGAIARNIILEPENSDKIVQFKRQANAFLERTISYLEKWYQYNNNRFENLFCMILKKSQILSVEKFIKI
ncbi:uncharacterized protein LOC130892238 isoform X1 [Diorhabda carinulata]|uniref:uncharacterized protein LOC130892238 isoform X1 n=1 Tax=Diorhabda carinulata TaxID=1163345 RepID=UPI0025A27597|nr:uncharacterized protein LOC130892238 isoform X1 [Diorhabda carinulata]